MEPYLEAPEIWRGFYHALAAEIIAQLHAVLGPRYYADIEVRPDVRRSRCSSHHNGVS
jgi:hypothetical protein